MGKRTKRTMLLTRSVISNPCLHREACLHAEGIAEATELETQMVNAYDVDILRAGGVFVDRASCMEGNQ